MSAPATKPGAYGTLSAALIVGLVFGTAEGCVSAPEVHASVGPEPAGEQSVDAPEANVEEISTASAEPQRPPPWSPPQEPVLDGVNGAAQLLARGEPEAALEQLTELDKLDTLEGEAALEPESREWFMAGAIAGRAYMATGQWQQAVLALEPLAASKRFGEALPADIVGYELARARIAWATQTGLDRATADLQLRRAIDELGQLRKIKPDRIQAAIRVAQGEAMAALRGPDERAIGLAAKKAVKALDSLVASFPNHPEVGEWMLQRALAKGRAGTRGAAQDSAAALRHVAIMRAGEPEAARAWAELEALAAAHEDIHASPLTTEETLAAGEAARILRRIDRSRELLESVWTDADQPRHRHREAGFSLAWTYYKAREYDRCVEVYAELYEQVPSMGTRNDLVRCLERAGRYGEAVDLWAGIYARNKGASGGNALWHALELAVDGGLYQRAADLLAEFETRYKGHGSERRWLHAWLPMRLGLDDEARAAFEQMLDTRRTGGRERTITYFLGKLELRSQNPDVRRRGVERLQALAAAGDERITATGVIGGHPIYYGLMARARLIEAGEDPGEPAAIEPLPWEQDERWTSFAETLSLLGAMAADHGAALPSLIRAEQLFAAGWREEASREVRMAADEYINGRAIFGGSGMPGTRSEALVAGLAWAPEWRQPTAVPSRECRKSLREDELREDLREDFLRLNWAMQEPYRYGKLTDWEQPYRSRWHLRAYREPIERHAWEREIDPHHLWALMYTESRFRRHVVSYVGARGALQIMPWTGRQLVEDLGEIERGDRFDPDILFNIEDNSRLATFYISELLKKFHGQPAFAYASYNGGPNNVARWLTAKSAGPTGVELDEFIEEIPFSETAGYARRVLEVHATYDLIYDGELPVWTNEVDPDYESNIDY